MDDLTPLINVAAAIPKTGWGTTTLGIKALVTFHIVNSTADSMKVCLAHAMVLGRADQNNDDHLIDLSAYTATEKGVSHRHASLEIVNETLMLTDLDSLNGTFLNHEQLAPNQPRIVRDGDEMQLGQLGIHIYYELPVTNKAKAIE